MNDLNHIVGVCRHAAASGNVGVLSTGEKLAAAVVLNRSDWLAELGYTIVQALDRIGAEWVAQLSAASKVLEEDDRVAGIVAEGIAKAKIRPQAGSGEGGSSLGLNYEATLVTYGGAPGYRSPSLTVDLREINGTLNGHRFRASLTLNAEDSAAVAQHIMREHAFAWSTPRGPIDKKEGETRPLWLRDV